MPFRKALAASFGAFLFLSTPALAQTGLQVGAKVTGPEGSEVGTISAIDGQFIIIQTDRHKARIPVTSVTATDEAVLFGLTREQLNAQIDQVLGQAQAAVTVGAVVHDREGAVIGPIESMDEQTITVKFGEQQIRLPRSAVAPGRSGLVIGATLAQVRAQLGGAAAGSE